MVTGCRPAFWPGCRSSVLVVSLTQHQPILMRQRSITCRSTRCRQPLTQGLYHCRWQPRAEIAAAPATAYQRGRRRRPAHPHGRSTRTVHLDALPVKGQARSSAAAAARACGWRQLRGRIAVRRLHALPNNVPNGLGPCDPVECTAQKRASCAAARPAARKARPRLWHWPRTLPRHLLWPRAPGPPRLGFLVPPAGCCCSACLPASGGDQHDAGACRLESSSCAPQVGAGCRGEQGC